MANEIRISGSQSTPRSETDVSVFRGDNLKIIAGSNVAASPGPQAQFFSADGGASWGQTALPLSQGDNDMTDPAVEWTTDGTAWAVTDGIQGGTLHLRCYKSVDGGQTWTFDSTPSGSDNGTDREAIWVDHSHTSPHKDNMYAVWQQPGPLRFNRRVGIGAPWDTPQTISSSETTGSAVGANIKTNQDGDVFAFWPDTGSRKLFVAKSTNGGQSFGTPIKIADTFASFKLRIPAQNDRGAGLYISGGAYKDSTNDIVHAVWADLSGETGCTSGSGPGTDVTSACKTRVWYSRSTNGGSNWSAPVKVNDQSSKNDQFFPTLAVDETNGNLALVYYDTVDDAGRHKVDLWMQVSIDNGQNWSPATKVTSASTDETVLGADNNLTPGGLDDQLGDYIGVTANAGVVWPAWCDRRSGAREEIWSTTLSLVTKRCFFIVDKSSFGEDEVGAMLAQGQGTFDAAFYVVIEGFTASELGIVAADLTGAPTHKPTINQSQAVSGMSIDPPTKLLAEDNSLPPKPQRFTWVYPITFTSASGFTQPVINLTVTSTMAGASCNAQIQLIQQPNPYELDGQTTWLSTDLRVFHIKENQSKFGATVNGKTPTDAINFLKDVITNLNPGGNSAGQTFENDLDPNATEVALNQFDSGGKAIFNFAIAKVRYKGVVQDANAVRVFFRLCPALTVSTTYDANDPSPTTAHTVGTVYKRFTDGVQFGQSIAMLGTQNNNILTIPCFATKRTSGDTKSQQDTPNVQKIDHDASGVEIHRYFGCWLDVNQDGDKWYPINPSGDGPFSGQLKSILELVRNEHQCLLSEIVFDPEPISNGATPGSSDKLAQRNLSLNPSANPGDPNSRRIASTFELKPTPSNPVQVDELMIDWGNTPAGSIARVFIPTVSSDQILELAAKRYSATKLTRLDDHTIELEVGQISYLPIPPGSTLNHTGLITVDLPEGVRRGQLFRIVVRQFTPFVESIVGAPGLLEPAASTQTITFRKVRGTFQISIPVSIKELMLEPEERLLSILRWILKSIPTTDRWYPVFSRYVGEIANRVDGLGGDSDGIRPSPNGDGRPKPAACDKIRWLVPLILAVLLVLIAVAPLIVSAPAIAIGVIVILAVVCYWYLHCRPSICEILAALLLGISVAYLVLGVLALLGNRPLSLVLMLAVLGIISGILVIASVLRGCCWECAKKSDDA